MATKTLTITEEAYKELKAMKIGTESFSQVIVRVANEEKGLPKELFGVWKGTKKKEQLYQRRKEIDKEVAARLRRFRRR
ncbi:MAG: hypothetical protein OXR66_09040 [Candidatus Woesearchaeota archaeon]|nr:hypothetical protein [Candidatus Woesearchaeota archaeon]